MTRRIHLHIDRVVLDGRRAHRSGGVRAGPEGRDRRQPGPGRSHRARSRRRPPPGTLDGGRLGQARRPGRPRPPRRRPHRRGRVMRQAAVAQRPRATEAGLGVRVSTPQEAHEREADRVADAVLAGPRPAVTPLVPRSGGVQRRWRPAGPVDRRPGFRPRRRRGALVGGLARVLRAAIRPRPFRRARAQRADIRRTGGAGQRPRLHPRLGHLLRPW